jgi:hypothetical protein
MRIPTAPECGWSGANRLRRGRCCRIPILFKRCVGIGMGSKINRVEIQGLASGEFSPEERLMRQQACAALVKTKDRVEIGTCLRGGQEADDESTAR